MCLSLSLSFLAFVFVIVFPFVFVFVFVFVLWRIVYFVCVVSSVEQRVFKESNRDAFNMDDRRSRNDCLF
jgi:hypothetical protein